MTSDVSFGVILLALVSYFLKLRMITIFSVYYLFVMCVGSALCHSMGAEVRGSSQESLCTFRCGFWGLNSGSEALRQELLQDEPLHSPTLSFLNYSTKADHGLKCL